MKKLTIIFPLILLLSCIPPEEIPEDLVPLLGYWNCTIVLPSNEGEESTEFYLDDYKTISIEGETHKVLYGIIGDGKWVTVCIGTYRENITPFFAQYKYYVLANYKNTNTGDVWEISEYYFNLEDDNQIAGFYEFESLLESYWGNFTGIKSPSDAKAIEDNPQLKEEIKEMVDELMDMLIGEET